MINSIRAFLLVSILYVPCYGQNPLHVSSKFPPRYLVERVLLDNQSGIEVLSAEYSGLDMAIGSFSYDSKYYIIKKGIILSTGLIEDALGPNERSDGGYAIGSPGDAELEKIASGKTYDAARLSFEFIADFDSLSFNFIFASEEYPEYVNRQVNDIFAFFLEDMETGQTRNLAVLESTGDAINVDNINSRKNKEFYIENAAWDPNNIMQWQNARQKGELAYAYQYDGFTSLLTAGCSLIPGKRYKISFVIADVGDRVYDSAVLIEQGSFKLSSSGLSEEMDKFKISLISELTDQSVEMISESNALILRLQINFEFDSYEIKDEYYLDIMRKVSRVMRLNPKVALNIRGNTDNVGSTEYNQELSDNRAKSAASFLKQSGVGMDRISTIGYGDTKPISDNFTEEGRWKNRRVEFEFFIPGERR